MEKYEEFKRKIMTMINYREEIPKEIMDSIKQVFNQIKEIYENNRCSNNFILNGIDLEMQALENIINNRVADSRRNDHFEEIMAVTSKMEHHIDEGKKLKIQ